MQMGAETMLAAPCGRREDCVDAVPADHIVYNVQEFYLRLSRVFLLASR